MLNIAVLISGGGTNLQSLIDAQNEGRLKSGAIKLVISDRPGVYGLKRAAENNIDSLTVDRKTFQNGEEFDKIILEHLRNYNIDIVVLAGFLSILGTELVKEYENRMINIHPSLIPSFCGEGFYGLKVHRAALEKGVKVTGATVHYVNEVADDGQIIMQKPVLVRDDDTPESLQKRVMKEAEWILLPAAVEQICSSAHRTGEGIFYGKADKDENL
ncbi:MAG TPA: phosphoribosylglycinamide formyltransferase [Anaerovoracaceae bacterium]|nr:phosphoribosylglycinamide formyltransferase [Anaerovoracaceae bacterium]